MYEYIRSFRLFTNKDGRRRLLLVTFRKIYICNNIYFRIMNTQASYEIFGTHRAVQYRQNTHIDEFNTRLSGRQFSDSPLEPNFDIRPVSTKYTLFPMLNHRKPV